LQKIVIRLSFFNSFFVCEILKMNNKNKTYISRNITEKLQLIIEIENNKKIKDVLKEFGVKQSIILTLHKNRDSLKWQGNQNPTALKSKKV
jgi:phenylalanyl-tRNA synthetase beta subunit